MMVIRSKMPTTFWKSSEIRRSLTHPSMCLGSHVSDTKFCLQSPRTVCHIGPRDFLRALSGAQTVPAMRTSLGSPTTRRHTVHTGKTQGCHAAPGPSCGRDEPAHRHPTMGSCLGQVLSAGRQFRSLAHLVSAKCKPHNGLYMLI